MVFFTLQELFDALLMTLFVGFIFSDIFKPQHITRDQVYQYYERPKTGFNWHNILFAASVTAPGILFHELGHKFAALSFGMVAMFNAAYTWLILGLILKLMNLGFIFFVPAYVSWGCPNQFCLQHLAQNPWIGSLIAFAGPGVNLLLWLLAAFLLKHYRFSQQWQQILVLTKRINLFLFIFNMLPIPPFDGYHVFSGLVRWLF